MANKEQEVMMVWLIGCKGMLGSEIARQLEQNDVAFIGTDRDVDITDSSALEKFAAGHEGITWIVNCSAYTAVDKAEDDADLAALLNETGAGNIAHTAKQIGAKMIHISTDYVFDGSGKTPYTENMPVSPLGVYGRTKAAGERAVQESGCAWYIFRTAWLYGYDGKNFVYTMINLMNSRDTISVVADQKGSPTFAADLARCIVITILNAVKGSLLPEGIYHCTDRGETTWFEFASEIYRLGREKGKITHNCTVKPCTTDEYPTRATRPAYSVLSKAKIQRALQIELPDWKESLRAFISSPLFSLK